MGFKSRVKDRVSTVARVITDNTRAAANIGTFGQIDSLGGSKTYGKDFLAGPFLGAYNEYKKRDAAKTEAKSEQSRLESEASVASAEKARQQAVVDAVYGDSNKRRSMLSGRSGGGRSLYANSSRGSGLYSI